MPGVAEIAGWVGLLSVPFFVGWDWLRPERRFDAPRYWRLRAAVVMVLAFYVAQYVG